jgi:16S rRNA (guanine(966)-N(2))-methyltransferase RsmD
VPEAGRVVAGCAGGLRLAAPGGGTRPVSDRVKQSLFSLLEAERPDVWDAAVLDLFSGSGALAIEALSRGAPRAVLVEHDRRAVTTIGQNLERTGLADRARVIRQEVAAFLAPGAALPDEAPFGAVFLDPPYAQVDDLSACLDALAGQSGWLDETALLVAKHFWKTAPADRFGALVLIRSRRFGETLLSVYRRGQEPAAGGS